jgi:hypothetical protein
MKVHHPVSDPDGLQTFLHADFNADEIAAMADQATQPTDSIGPMLETTALLVMERPAQDQSFRSRLE